LGTSEKDPAGRSTAAKSSLPQGSTRLGSPMDETMKEARDDQNKLLIEETHDCFRIGMIRDSGLLWLSSRITELKPFLVAAISTKSSKSAGRGRLQR